MNIGLARESISVIIFSSPFLCSGVQYACHEFFGVNGRWQYLHCSWVAALAFWLLPCAGASFKYVAAMALAVVAE
jgi:hypothetical protein